MSDRNKYWDRLESFFRSGLEKADFEFVEEDWTRMERMLDEAQPVAPTPWWRSRWFILSAVLALFGILGMLVWQGPISHESGPSAGNAVPRESTEQYGPSIDGERSQLRERSSAALGNDISNKQQGMKSVDEQDGPALNLYGQQQTGAGSTADGNTADAVADVRFTVESNDDEADTAPARFVLSSVEESAATPSLERTRQDFIPTPIVRFVPPDPDMMTTYTPIERANQQTIVKPPSSSTGHRFPGRYLAIGVTGSPDFSAVGLPEFDNSGSRAGFAIEYGISRRLVLSTAVIVTNSKYKAYGEDYQPPYGFWTKGVVPAATHGECRMIDIPLDLRYNIALWPRHRLFVRAGVSSYVMMREKYHYEYHNPDPDLITDWQHSDSYMHWFGIGNTSVGYEYLLSPRLSLQVEPFAKFALTGIGYGKVTLNSIGTYFSLKYFVLSQ